MELLVLFRRRAIALRRQRLVLKGLIVRFVAFIRLSNSELHFFVEPRQMKELELLALQPQFSIPVLRLQNCRSSKCGMSCLWHSNL